MGTYNEIQTINVFNCQMYITDLKPLFFYSELFFISTIFLWILQIIAYFSPICHVTRSESVPQLFYLPIKVSIESLLEMNDP